MDNVRSHIIQQSPQDPSGFAAEYNQIRVVFLSILDNSTCACQDDSVSGELGTSVCNCVCSRLERLTRLNIARNHITIPMVAIYVIFHRQVINGITEGTLR